jgi:Glycosyltransferase family 9 (heptosyltransferase)
MGRVFVAPISYGIGDLVVSLPAIQALIAAGGAQSEETWLVARAPGQRRLASRIVGLGGCVDEASLWLGEGDRLVDLRDHPLQRDFWWGSAEFEEKFGPLDINEILGRICADFGIAADLSGPIPLAAHPCPELSASVLLVNETDGADKAWPAERWASVAAQLGAAGFDVRQVSRSVGPDDRQETGIPQLCAPTLGSAVDVLTACRAVIGVDTGLTHIAAQQRTPTVTICRRSSVYFRPWSHCRVLRGERCTDECMAVEAAYAYNDQVSLRDLPLDPRTCPSGAPCLEPTRPAQAVALLRELL